MIISVVLIINMFYIMREAAELLSESDVAAEHCCCRTMEAYHGMMLYSDDTIAHILLKLLSLQGRQIVGPS